jgi:hypothetical protein
METTTEDQTPMQAQPQQEHDWLQRFVGEWTYEGEAGEPGKETEKSSGTESVRSLGGLWVLGEGSTTMPDGSPATTLLTLGYDPDKKRFVGTWIGSMMTYLWVYDGELDSQNRVLTLNCEGPSMLPEGGTAKYRDVHEFVDGGHRVMTSHVQQADGTWAQFLTAHYRRK